MNVSCFSGIDDAASEVEENIALVTFGGDALVAQHLTNDYGRIRDALGRFSIFFT
jgi:hypothetical protein